MMWVMRKMVWEDVKDGEDEKGGGDDG